MRIAERYYDNLEILKENAKDLGLPVLLLKCDVAKLLGIDRHTVATRYPFPDNRVTITWVASAISKRS